MSSSTAAAASSFGERHDALSRLALVGCITVFLFSVVLRLDACRDDLWLDELHTAWVAEGRWDELVARAAIGNQTPLYFAIEKVVISVVGASEWSLRLVSIGAGIGLIVVAWRFVWLKTRDHACALISVAAIGLDHTGVFYSSEARPYALMQLAFACHLIVALREKSGWVPILTRGILAALAIQLQITSVLFLAPLYALRLLVITFGGDAGTESAPGAHVRMCTREACSRRSRAIRFFLEVLLVALVSAPLLAQVVHVASRAALWELVIPRPSLEGAWAMFAWLPAILGVCAFAINWGLGHRDQRQVDLGKLCFAAIAPLILALGAHQLDLAPLFFRRYLLGCLWPLAVIPGLCAAGLRGVAKGAVVAVLLGAIVFQCRFIDTTAWSDRRLSHPRFEGWSDATKQVVTLTPRGEAPLFVVSGLIESRLLKTDPRPLLRDYCRLPVATLYRVRQSEEEIEPVSSLIPAEPPEPWLERVSKSDGGIWLIRISPQYAGKWERFLQRFRQALTTREPDSHWKLTMHGFPGITVFELRRNPADVQ